MNNSSVEGFAFPRDVTLSWLLDRRPWDQFDALGRHHEAVLVVLGVDEHRYVHPKFSKSIPGSAINVTTLPEQVHQLLAAEPPVPHESAAYQLMCQLPRYDAAALLELHGRCVEGGPAWRRDVGHLAEYVIGIHDLWPH